MGHGKKTVILHLIDSTILLLLDLLAICVGLTIFLSWWAIYHGLPDVVVQVNDAPKIAPLCATWSCCCQRGLRRCYCWTGCGLPHLARSGRLNWPLATSSTPRHNRGGGDFWPFGYTPLRCASLFLGLYKDEPHFRFEMPMLLLSKRWNFDLGAASLHVDLFSVCQVPFLSWLGCVMLAF
jgi:hypothetical protein